MNILAIIPARGGSKGVPGKNKKLLKGVPLLEYSVRCAIECKEITEVMVSTEDQEIAQIAESAGAEVPFLRPMHLATDSASSIDVILHVLERYKEMNNKDYDAICLLQPTVPFRNPIDVREAIKTFMQSNVDSLVTMRKVPHKFHPDWVYIQDGIYTSLYSGVENPINRRQELTEAWYRDGSIYLCKRDTILNDRTLYGKKMIHYEMKNSPDINIDTMEDWKEAVLYLNQQDA